MKYALIGVLIAEMLFITYYCLLPVIRKGKKTFSAQMVCVATFVIIGILSTLTSGRSTVYSTLVLIGAAFGAFGDFSLKMDVNNPGFYIGLGSFLVGHLFYVAAFVTTLFSVSPFSAELVVFPVLAAAVLVGSFTLAGKKLGVAPGKGTPAVIAYMVIISLMTVFGITLSVKLVGLKGVSQDSVMSAVSVILGSLLFVASDAELALEAFSEKKRKISRLANPLTYFPAQILIAVSTLFVNNAMR